MTDDLTVAIYKDHEITLTSRKQFRVTIEGDEYRDCETYAGACEQIDKLVISKAKQASAKLSLPVLTESGQTCAITGLNLGNGNILTDLGKSLKLTRYGSTDFYVDHPAVLVVKAEADKLQEQLYVKKALLSRFEIKHRSYRMRGEDYPAEIEKLEAAFAEAKANAESYAAGTLTTDDDDD